MSADTNEELEKKWREEAELEAYEDGHTTPLEFYWFLKGFLVARRKAFKIEKEKIDQLEKEKEQLRELLKKARLFASVWPVEKIGIKYE